MKIVRYNITQSYTWNSSYFIEALTSAFSDKQEVCGKKKLCLAMRENKSEVEQSLLTISIYVIYYNKNYKASTTILETHFNFTKQYLK
jgi:hypothetical protein